MIRQPVQQGPILRLYKWFLGSGEIESIDPNQIPKHGVWFDPDLVSTLEYVLTTDSVNAKTVSFQNNYIIDTLKWILETIIKGIKDLTTLILKQENNIKEDLQILSEQLIEIEAKFDARTESLPDNLSEAIQRIIDLQNNPIGLDNRLDRLENRLSIAIKEYNEGTQLLIQNEMRFLNQKIEDLMKITQKKLEAIKEAVGAREIGIATGSSK